MMDKWSRGVTCADSQQDGARIQARWRCLAVKMFIALVGLVLVLEGLPYAAFPEAMRNWLRQVAEVEPAILRTLGWLAVSAGLLLCYLSQRTGFFD